MAPMVHVMGKAAKAMKRMTGMEAKAAGTIIETSDAPATAVPFDSWVMDWAEERINAIFLTSHAEPDQLRESAEVLAVQKDLFEEGIKKKGTKAGDSSAIAVIPLFLTMIEAELKLAHLLERQPRLVECIAQARQNFDLPGQSKRVQSQLARGAKRIVDIAEDNVAQEQVHLSKLIHAKMALTRMQTEDDVFAQLYAKQLKAAEQNVENAWKKREESEKAEDSEGKKEEGPKPQSTKGGPKLALLEEKLAMPPELIHGNVAVKDLSLRLGKKKEAAGRKVKEAAIERALKKSRRSRHSQDEILVRNARNLLARRAGQGIKKPTRSAFAELADDPEAGKILGLH